MRKVKMAMVMLVFLISFTGCGENKPENNEVSSEYNYDSEIESAINVLKETWIDDYNRIDIGQEYYLEIKNTRIIFIKDNAIDGFEEYDYIVEFVLFSDYFGSAPYYINAQSNDSVVVYTDGHAECYYQSRLSKSNRY